MTRIALTGCRSDPLGAYLTGLGAWRAVVRLADPHARAHWEGGYLVLTTKLDEQGVIAMFCGSFEPVPIVSPWNSGSGFAGNGKSRSAEDALEAVRTSSDPRLARLRAVVLAADDVVREGRACGWGGPKGELWAKSHKADVITLCRNRLPDDALPWLDAAVVLAQVDEPSYSRLLGTGGNFGRQDLSATYVARALTVLADPRYGKRVEPWLRAALFGDESVPYLREAVGQFDPGRAGGVQSSPLEDRDKDGFANPWALLFMLEGAVLFASAAVRRQGALAVHAALPFQVRSSSVGFGSSALAEQALGEMWTPEWDRPAPLAEIAHLLASGLERAARPHRARLRPGGRVAGRGPRDHSLHPARLRRPARSEPARGPGRPHPGPGPRRRRAAGGAGSVAERGTRREPAGRGCGLAASGGDRAVRDRRRQRRRRLPVRARRPRTAA